MNTAHDTQGAVAAAAHGGEPKSPTHHTSVLPDGTRVVKTKRRRHLHDGSTFLKTRTEKFSAASGSAPTTHVIVTKTKRINSNVGFTVTTVTKEEMQENAPVTHTRVLPDGSRVIKSVTRTASPVTTTTTVHLKNIPGAKHQIAEDAAQMIAIYEDDEAPMPPQYINDTEWTSASKNDKAHFVSGIDIDEDDEDAPIPPQFAGAIYEFEETPVKKLRVEEIHEEEDIDDRRRARGGVRSGRKFRLPRNVVAPVPVGPSDNARDPTASPTMPDVDEECLAVANPVDGEPIYRATKYSPEAKTPFYKQTKCILWTVVALLLISVLVAVTVVFTTREVAEENQVQPEVSKLEALGIKPHIEASVLQRNATFHLMSPSDPRRLALEWILHKDGMQLERLDKRLTQRYVLALFAFTFDSLAWEVCGNHTSPVDGREYAVESCQVEDDNGQEMEHSVWLSSTDECSWYGVTCDGGYVRELDVTYNGLIGELPPEIGRLNLTHLSLNDNCIYGTLPPEMSTMSSLEHLTLDWNGLSGTFPVEANFQNLVELRLNDNHLNDYMECERSDGTVVSTMYAQGNEANGENPGLSGTIFGHQIGAMTSLKEISIGGNAFSGTISSEIGRLKELAILHAGFNNFTGSLPSEIADLTSLEELKLSVNSISGELPQNIGDMKSLEIVFLYKMALGGTIPDSLYDLSNMTELIIRDNAFEGSLSANVGNLIKLTDFDISGSRLTGTLPSEIGLCQDLKRLDISATQIRGTVPEEVCSLRLKTELNFRADCSPNNITLAPFFTCDCCTSCCDHTTEVCLKIKDRNL